ncbi:MAG: outer membrane lipoprotein carrier protein LolA [Lentisphaeria bacterium]|nr:outer membrane lipoprotein carrier protein LolA [Lentisphaeria bacterium]
MTFNPAVRILTAVLLSVCASFAFAGEDAAQTGPEPREAESEAAVADTAELLANISNFRTLRTKFVQTKHLKAFKKPMVLNGELCLDRPGKRFAWHVEKPLKYSCVIANGKLTQWDADSDKTVSVPFSKYPMLEMLSDAMTAFASGDVKALEKDFEAAAGKDGTVVLKPRSERFAASLITEVELTLDESKTKIVKVRASEKNGDVTELVYTDSVFDSDIPDALWQAKQKK